MAGVQGARLAAAVCQAGGLGSLPAGMLSPAGLDQAVRDLRAATVAPFLVNFFCHRPPQPDAAREAAWRALLQPHARRLGVDLSQVPAGATRVPFGAEAAAGLEALPAAQRPAVVSFHFGLPDEPLLARVRALGVQVWSSATTVDEARWLQARGVDAIIAQGLEAGGHRGHFLRNDLDGQAPLADLLPAVLAAVGTPVVAAGGLAGPGEVAAALAAGADAVQVGSAYLQADEAETSRVHRTALQAAMGDTTALTRLFSGRPARGLTNRLMRELGPMNPVAPEFPLASAALAPLRAAAEAQGLDDLTPLWAGTRAHCGRVGPAAAITAWLMTSDDASAASEASRFGIV